MHVRIATRLSLLCAGLLMVTLQGCHTMRFELENTRHEKVVEETNWFYMFGWFPSREINVAQKCPAGAAALKEKTTFTDGIIELFTIGIVSPKSAWYYCLPEPAAMKPLTTIVPAPVPTPQGGAK